MLVLRTFNIDLLQKRRDTATMMTTSRLRRTIAKVRWVFDPLPASGARRGGDPSEHAFRHDLETFVREVEQA